MNKPRGYTVIEVITAVLVVAVLLLVGIVISNPSKALQDEYREAQMDDVRDYMEVVFELQATDMDTFYELAFQAQDQKVMIGIGEGCDGSFGIQCEDFELSDSCLNIQEYLPEGMLTDLPYDISDDQYSRVRTGYYLLYDEDVLEIGACDPSGVDHVRLMSLIR